MDDRIVQFAELLRHNGIRVSPGEVTDAARAVMLLGLDDRSSLRATLRTTMLKRGLDAATFDRLFEVYFTGAAALLDDVDASLAKALEDEGVLDDDHLQMILAQLGQLVGEMSPLTQALLRGDRGALARLFRQAALKVDFSKLENQLQTGFYARRMMSALGVGDAERDLQAIDKALRERGASAEDVEVVSHKLGDLLRHIEEAARTQVALEAKARVRRATGTLEDRPFANLSPEEMERTATAVRRLAERLKTRLVRRQKSRRRGTLNVRRTLRANLSWGGVPAKLAFRKRRPQRPDVVVLCDVSDSVRNVSRMMLLFVYTLQSLFSRVRTFVFVSDVGEVTATLKGLDARQAVDVALAAKAINVHANSNYGRALGTFAIDHLGLVTRRTTVIVIGDGRNNYNPANLWALKDIKRKAKRVVWICPEEKRAWGLGDSEMLQYAKSCDRVAVVQSLSDLMDAADELVPKGV